MFEYEARCYYVADGDTVDLEVDLGFKVSIRVRVRFKGINAPEIRGPERDMGRNAKYFVESVLSDKSLVVRTFSDKQGKWGRWLAQIFVKDFDGSPWSELTDEGWLDLNAEMLARDLAVPYDVDNHMSYTEYKEAQKDQESTTDETSGG